MKSLIISPMNDFDLITIKSVYMKIDKYSLSLFHPIKHVNLKGKSWKSTRVTKLSVLVRIACAVLPSSLGRLL